MKVFFLFLFLFVCQYENVFEKGLYVLLSSFLEGKFQVSVYEVRGIRSVKVADASSAFKTISENFQETISLSKITYKESYNYIKI